jgi:hypothetical protein
MAAAKTTETDNSVTDFINAVPNEQMRNDSFALIEIMKRQTGCEPKRWGTAIIGFGSYHYTYESGREGDAPLVAFSPRKSELVLYLSANFENHEALLQKLGKHKTGKACIYIKKLSDVDTAVLGEMIALSAQHVKNLYP